MQFQRIVAAAAAFSVLALVTPAALQLGGRPAEEWIKTLDGPVRVASLRIDDVVAALKLQPGQTVADIGAGSGLFEVPLAKAVGPRGRVYAVEIDAAFFPEIRKRAAAADVTNVETVLGKFTDPALPVKSVDVAFFHDVLHHVEQRGPYLKTVSGYLAPTGRIVIVDYEGGKGPHSGQPALEVTRQQVVAWMQEAGFTQTEDIKLFADKYFLVFTKGAGPQAARPMRTEAEARERAEANRRAREEKRRASGADPELIHDYVRANVAAVPESLGVNAFYKKYTDALGIPVVASEKVPDAAILVARDIVNSMLAARPDIRKALVARRWRTGVIAEVEMTMDIPEYSRMKRPGAPPDEPVVQADRDYHANRSRGLGGNPTTGAEENLLGYPGTRYWGEHIFVHEFAHAMMTGLRDVDPTMHGEIRAAYDKAMAASKYVYDDGRKHYATTNANEYWAEGVQWWFFSNFGECFAGKTKVETPEEFGAYDPVLNELIGRVFTTHRIPMDVFHARRIRPVDCDPSVDGLERHLQKQ